MGQYVLRQLQMALSQGNLGFRLPQASAGWEEIEGRRRRIERRALSRALAGPWFEDLMKSLGAYCHEAAAQLRSSRNGQDVDLVARYSAPVLEFFLSRLFGVGEGNADTVGKWMRALEAFSPAPAGKEYSEAETARMWRLLATRVVQSAKDPGDDFIGILVSDGDQLQGFQSAEAYVKEIIGKCLMIAHVTTQGLALGFSTMVRSLIMSPDQYQRIHDDLALVDAAIDEGLRFDSPTQALGRLVRKTTSIDGELLDEGQLVVVLVGSAHRDPRAWEDADCFDITRDRNTTPTDLAFSMGEASCVGAKASRRVLSVMLQALVDTLPSIKPAAGETWLREFTNRGLTRLPIEIG
jgi:cytochrome P450